MPSERVQRRIDLLLDQADEAVVAHDWSTVKARAESVLAFDPNNTDAQEYIAAADRAVRSSDGQDFATIEEPPQAPTSSQPHEAPASFADGRYNVSQFLGEGGKKKVYLAHDTTLDRDVAFAIIKTDGLDDVGRERVRREAQAMGRMGTHPHIMPIYDFGDEAGQPFMVQPVMAGGDVEGLIEDAEGPLELETAIRIAQETCRGLQFAHDKGIVHRDLKPGNVWLDEDGSAKIGDFGLAVATDLSRLTVEKVMVGTVNYMPPEQATGGEVTSRADLYSLGAMLYEMCTGRVPFMGDDEIAVIGQHVNTPPVAPSWHNSAIPASLDSLIMRLMAKDPAERPESAGEVIAALRSIDISAAAAEEREASLDSMAGGVFVGRHREMDRLKALFEEVLSGHGRMATLVGEPGIGKTRTAQELATYAGMRGAQVLWGRSYEGGGAPPYWPWVQAVRAHVAATEPQALRTQLGAAGPVIAEIVPDVREKLPDLPAPVPLDDPESARFRLFDSLATFLKNASASAPIVLMLEDLHWADRPSLMLLEFVARELANSKIMVVGNYRDVELNRRHPLSVTLGDLSRERLFERILLRGLQRHDVERFIEIAAGIAPPAALVNAVHTQTEGNPLFVTETVRLLVQEGQIASGTAAGGGTSSWEIRIPEGVREVIGRRLDRLSERCNEVLTTAAVVGRQFRFGVLMRLMSPLPSAGEGQGEGAMTENMLLDVLDEALSARIVEEVPSEVGLYQFTHASMQETLTSELSANRRVRLHARIAEALEEYYGDEAEDHAAELVEHFAEAEMVLGAERLVQYGIVAGESSLAAYAYDDARRYFERVREAAEGLPDGETKARFYYGCAQPLVVEASSEARQEGWDLLGRAFRLFKEAGNFRMATAAAQTPVTFGELKGTVELTGAGLELAEPGTLDAGYLHARHAIALRDELGDLESELEHLEKALAIAKAKDDARLEARTLIHYAQHYSYVGDEARTVEYCDRAAEIASRVGDPATEQRAVGWALAAHLCLWQVDEFKRKLTPARQIADRYRQDVYVHGIRRREWGFAVATGDWDTARHVADSEESRRPGNPWTPTWLGVVDIQTREVQLDEPELLSIDDYAILDWGLAAHSTIAWMSHRGAPRLSGYISDVWRRTAALGYGFVRTHAVLGGLVALMQRDAGLLEKAAAPLEPWSDQFDFGTGVTVDHVHGLVHAARGDAAAAWRCLERARVRCRDAGFRPLAAYVAVDQAELLRDRDEPGDRESAAQLEDEALAIARDLGMKPLLERVLRQREILKA